MKVLKKDELTQCIGGSESENVLGKKSWGTSFSTSSADGGFLCIYHGPSDGTGDIVANLNASAAGALNNVIKQSQTEPLPPGSVPPGECPVF